MRRRPSTPGTRLRVLGVLVLAVGLGAVAALLAVPAPAAPGAAPTASGSSPNGSLGPYLILLALVLPAMVLGLVGWRIYIAWTGEAMRTPVVFLLVAIVGLAVGVGLSVVLHVIASGSSSSSSSGTSGTTPGGGSGSGGSGGNNSSSPLGSPGANPWGVSLPGWALAVGVLAAVFLVLLLVVGPWLAGRGDESGAPAPVSRARSDLERALRDLDASDPADARAAILAVYGRLLLRVAPMMRGRLEPATAREVEAEIVSDLGVRWETAHVLTTVFEEARYSSHPLGPAAVSQAREALAGALRDLDARPQSVAPAAAPR